MEALSESCQLENWLQTLLADDLDAMELCLEQQLQSDVPLVHQVARHIITAGGKRLRPMILLLMARACDYQGSESVPLAVAIEFIHTATLLHDDVVDDSHWRRGKKTANDLWGNAASVLVGDFLYSRAFQLIVRLGQGEIMDIIADATNIIAEGEVMQLMNIGNAETSEQRYLQVIHNKTAKLFEATARLGSLIAGYTTEHQQQLARYGMHVGTAFQLVDDALDYRGDTNQIGKNLGDDLAEGKPTLPLIRALAVANPQDQQLLRQVIEQGDHELEQLQTVLAIVESCDAITYTYRVAEQEVVQAKQALACLPDTCYRQALEALADFSLQRHH